MKNGWKKRIKEQALPPNDRDKIRETITPEHISFSYKYLDSEHNKFQYSNKKSDYFCKVIDRFKSLCSLTALDVLSNRSAALRCHPIKWEETTERRFGLPQENIIVDTPYQFEISKSEHGRVHGFFIGPVFHIVWFDPDHNLYN